MEEYDNVIKKIEELISEIEVSSQDTNEKIIKKIIKELDNLTINEGYLVADNALFTTINKVDKIINDLLKKGAYFNSVNELLVNFESIGNDIVSFHENFNKIKPSKILKELPTLKKLAINQIYDSLLNSGVDYEYTKPIKDLIIYSASTGQSLQKTKDLFNKMNESGVSFGTVKTKNLKSYATQISRDFTYSYQGAVNSKIAELYDMNGFVYVGGSVKDTRPICLKLISLNKIKFVDLPKLLSNTSKEGMVPNTNKDNFLIYRGGYNCRHEAIPTIIEDGD